MKTDKQRRAVAYVRVSTASDAQLHSYEFQEQYWHDRIDSDPALTLVNIYADRGISGSSMYKRPQFLVMLQDAREKKFDVIYTKSVSRFARNTVQLLETVRELRELGIEVVFEKENISTLQSTSDVYLTIAATIAENDLEVDSQRQRWSIQRRCESGWISIGNQLYGYKMLPDNTLEIVPEEAEVVRRIYQMYIDGAGCMAIAKKLNSEGITRSRAKGPWYGTQVLEVLSNEKYMGDCLMGKNVYHFGQKQSNKDGTLAKRYYIEDTHEGIVSKDTWHLVQRIRKERENAKIVGQPKPTHPFAKLIVCGQCGKYYQHKINNSGKKWAAATWYCATGLRKGVSVCDCTSIKESVLHEKFVEAYNEFVTKRPQGETVRSLQNAIDRLQNEERELASLHLSRMIPEKAYRAEAKSIKAQIAALRDRCDEQRSKMLRESDFTVIDKFDETKIEKFITKVIVRKGAVTFVFYNGAEITKAYTNGTPGNKPGWNKKED